MAEHTPGPWVVRGEGTILCVTDGDSRYIVDRFLLGSRPLAEHRANARLIAAAPDLLESSAALARIVRELFDGLAIVAAVPRNLALAVEAVEDAIAKATTKESHHAGPEPKAEGTHPDR